MLSMLECRRVVAGMSMERRVCGLWRIDVIR